MTALFLLGCQSAQAAPVESTLHLISEVQWTALNPARGDASPRAATLWGDRAASGPSGFLVKFADGFSSPPHIHNVTYRAVVLSGEVHNDDAGAAPMWMVPGSFWTQPQAEAHITSSRGASMAYVEIDDGPYLVHPAEQAKAAAEKPVNVDASNLVWTHSTVDGADVSRLWGAPDEGMGGIMVRLEPGSAAVVVAGTPKAGAEGHTAAAGSLISGTDPLLQCPAGATSCVFYVRTARGFTLAAMRTDER